MTDSETPTNDTNPVEWSKESKKFAIRTHRSLGFLIAGVFSPQFVMLGVLSHVWNGTASQLPWRIPQMVAFLVLAFVGLHFYSRYSVNAYSSKHTVSQFAKLHSRMLQRGMFDLPYPIHLILLLVGATAAGWVAASAIHLLRNAAPYSLLDLSLGILMALCVTVVLTYPIFAVVKHMHTRSLEKIGA